MNLPRAMIAAGSTLLAGVAVTTILLVVTASSGATATTGGQFLTHCNFYPTYQRAQVDPIVAHGLPVSKHLHDFWGFQGVTPDTVAATVLPPSPPRPPDLLDPGYTPVPTSCGAPGTLEDYGDWAAYWAPSAYISGVLSPAYNNTGAGAPNSDEINTFRSPVGSTVLPPPFGMTYVAGDASAPDAAHESSHIAWSCGALSPTYRAPHNCTNIGVVTAIATFPRCWNQQHGWGADGWDGTVAQPVQYDGAAGIAPIDFAYGNPCPAGFTAIAQLLVREHFTDIGGGPLINPYTANGKTLRLTFSSGGYWTFHTDFMNLWNIGIKQLTDQCLNTPGGAATSFCTDPLR